MNCRQEIIISNILDSRIRQLRKVPLIVTPMYGVIWLCMVFFIKWKSHSKWSFMTTSKINYFYFLWKTLLLRKKNFYYHVPLSIMFFFIIAWAILINKFTLNSKVFWFLLFYHNLDCFDYYGGINLLTH